MMPGHSAAAASIVCGAAAIAEPGGPTAVPFRACCALAIIHSTTACRAFDRASSAAADDQSGFDDAAAYLVREPL